MASTSADLFAAIEAGDDMRVRSMLESDASLAGARDGEGVSALMRARYRSNRRLTDAVRDRVTDLDVFEAAAFADVRRLRSLLDEEPELVSARSGDGFTPLHFAAFFGTADVVAMLVARGADVESAGAGWMTGTALHSAASANRADVVEVLLDAGADPNARQSKGHTPLHSAAHNGNGAIVTLLIDRGADPAAATDDGRDALSFARETGDAGSIQAIEEALHS
jgi:ankyrin repeat protein